VDGNPHLWRDWRRGGRNLVLRDRYFALAGRTLERVAAPKLVAREFLVAVGADEFEFSHNVRLLTASFQFLGPAEVHNAGVRAYLQHCPEFTSRKCALLEQDRGKTSTAPDLKCVRRSSAAVDE
jgi:hypothetical protein